MSEVQFNFLTNLQNHEKIANVFIDVFFHASNTWTAEYIYKKR